MEIAVMLSLISVIIFFIGSHMACNEGHATGAWGAIMLFSGIIAMISGLSVLILLIF